MFGIGSADILFVAFVVRAIGLTFVTFAVGRVVAGVIGKRKFTYDLWGDAANTASRMYSFGMKGRIQTTAATIQGSPGTLGLANEFDFESRGIINVKGKGDMECFLLIGPKPGHVRRTGKDHEGVVKKAYMRRDEGDDEAEGITKGEYGNLHALASDAGNHEELIAALSADNDMLKVDKDK